MVELKSILDILNEDAVEKITQLNLMRMYQIVNELGDEHEIMHHLLEVISFYSTVEEFEEFIKEVS